MAEMSFDERLDIIKREVDLLQIAQTAAHRPWYREASTIISISAFIFSLATAGFSALREHQKDIHDSRAELRTLILRITQLPVEALELSKKVQGAELGVAQNLGNQLNVLALQAYEISKEESVAKYITSPEYLVVAQSLAFGNNNAKANDAFEKAAERASTLNEAVNVYRAQGSFRYYIGDTVGAEAAFNKADDAAKSSRYGASDVIVQYNLATNHGTWASAAAAGDCQQAARQIVLARSLIDEITVSQAKGQLSQQLNGVISFVAQACPLATMR